MTRSMPSRAGAIPFAFALMAGVCCWPVAGVAQAPEPPAPPPSDTIRLSDAERDAILDSNTVESAAAARGELTGSGGAGGPGIHGEIGAMIGSNGTRGAYGVAAIPLGDNAGAVVSFESSRFGGYRRGR